MVFNHLVKYNNKYYPAGSDVPIEEPATKHVEKKTYTKTEILRMTTSELQKLADNEGIENALETSGAKLKEMLIEHFEL